MNDELQECFVVFVRDGTPSVWHPEEAERRVAACPSYEDAARVREKFRQSGKTCIIRCVSQTGGSD
jgi:hypothetical protein